MYVCIFQLQRDREDMKKELQDQIEQLKQEQEEELEVSFSLDCAGLCAHELKNNIYYMYSTVWV